MLGVIQHQGWFSLLSEGEKDSKGFRVVVLSGVCVFLKAGSWPEFHLSGPLHQYGAASNSGLPPLTTINMMILAIMELFEA